MKHYNINFWSLNMDIRKVPCKFKFYVRSACILGAIFGASLSYNTLAAPKAPLVVVSIAPLYVLVSDVMQGVGAPSLLVPAGASAHDFSLRPTGASMLARADLRVWIGGEFERFLRKPLKAVAHGRTLSLIDKIDGLPARGGGVWSGGHSHAGHEGHESHAGYDNHESHKEHDADEREIDPHFWLDPENAKQAANVIATTLGEIDPLNAQHYQRNAGALGRSIDRATSQVAEILAPIRTVPYIVFHDAYQYFEAHFELNAVGSVVVDPEHSPGARRLREVRQKIRESGAQCVFHEPQFKPRLVETIIRNTPAKSAVLDPLGVGLPSGVGAYQKLLLRLAGQLRACLNS
jgi:zinc transport system substrate-binding protein